MEQLVQRGAISDQQQEEQAIFQQAASSMDQGLMQQQSRDGAASDSMAKLLHQNRHAHRNQFLSGAGKRVLVEERRADEAVQQQYYSYQFV